MHLNKRLAKLNKPMAMAIAATFAVLTPGAAVAEVGLDEGQSDQGAAAATAASQATQGAVTSAVANAASGIGLFRIRLGAVEEGGQTGLAASADAASPWSLWATPVVVNVDNDVEPLTSRGDVAVLMAGLEHSRDDALITGVVFSYSWSDLDTANTDRRTTGNAQVDAYNISPYLAWQITPEWLLDASLGYGNGKVDSQTNDGGLVTISRPDSNSRFATLGLSHNRTIGTSLLLTPKTSLSYSVDRIGATTNSAGALELASETKLATATVGVQLMKYDLPLKPFIGVYQIFRDASFSSDDPAVTEPRFYQSTQQLQLGVNGSLGLLYGAMAAQMERGQTQFRAYVGIRY